MLNYNSWDMTIDCINSLRANCMIPYKVYIVDNASIKHMTDKFMVFISKAKDCELLKNDSNKGYSAGNNVGIKKALEEGCEYILISNNDVIFRKNSIEKLCEYLNNHCEYGIAGPKIYLQSGDIQEINMGCKMTLAGKYKYILRKTPFKGLTTQFVNKFHATSQDLSRPFDVYAVSGCCFMMSRYAAEQLFPMDENTFLYEEENIIGCRMEKLGLKTVYDSESEIIHLGGASTQGESALSYSWLVESEIYYCLHYLKALRIQIIPLFIIRTANYIIKYRVYHLNIYLRKSFSILLRKRRI